MKEIIHSYLSYMNIMYNKGTINSRIINYISESSGDGIDHTKWMDATTAGYNVVKGVGDHHSMFYSMNSEKNSRRIKEIFFDAN